MVARAHGDTEARAGCRSKTCGPAGFNILAKCLALEKCSESSVAPNPSQQSLTTLQAVQAERVASSSSACVKETCTP